MMNKVETQQTEFYETFVKLPPVVRFALVILIAAIAAYYIPFLTAALFGRMLNQLWMWLELGVSATGLIILTLIGNKLNRIWLVAGIAVTALAGYQLSLGVRMVMPGGWPDFLWKASLPVVSILLNAALFVWGRKYARLNKGHEQNMVNSAATSAV